MKRILLTIAAIGTMAAAAPVMAQDAADLAKAKNCMSCHAVDKKLVGPTYKEVAKKHAGDADAVATLAKHIKEGSSGVWGAIPMPPNNVTEEEATQLATWVMAQ